MSPLRRAGIATIIMAVGFICIITSICLSEVKETMHIEVNLSKKLCPGESWQFSVWLHHDKIYNDSLFLAPSRENIDAFFLLVIKSSDGDELVKRVVHGFYFFDPPTTDLYEVTVVNMYEHPATFECTIYRSTEYTTRGVSPKDPRLVITFTAGLLLVFASIILWPTSVKYGKEECYTVKQKYYTRIAGDSKGTCP